MSKIKVYIAASYTAHALAEEVGNILEPYCEVVSTWHKPENVVDDDNLDVWDAHQRACVDLSQIRYCDCLLYLSTPHPSKGGRDFEMGYACALGKRVFRFGHTTHIFSCGKGSTFFGAFLGIYPEVQPVYTAIRAAIDKHVAELEQV